MFLNCTSFFPHSIHFSKSSNNFDNLLSSSLLNWDRNFEDKFSFSMSGLHSDSNAPIDFGTSPPSKFVFIINASANSPANVPVLHIQSFSTFDEYFLLHSWTNVSTSESIFVFKYNVVV